MLKRCFSTLMTIIMLFGTAAFAAETNTENTPEKTFKMAGYESCTTRTWAKNAFFARMEENTGIHFEFDEYTDKNNWDAYKNSLTADAALPDVLFKANLSGGEAIDLMEKGVLIDLKPYITAEKMPNLTALLQQFPDVMDAITLPGGQVAALPYINETPLNCGIWVNKTFLSAWGHDMPTDKDSFTEMLRFFVNGDPNRNAKKDEVGLSFIGPFDLRFLMHAFGLNANNYNMAARNGEAVFVPEEQAYYDFVSWLHDLYTEGLIDQKGFINSTTTRTVTDENATATYGVFISQSPTDVIPASWDSKYILMMPLTYQGKQVYRDYFGNCLTGTFAITAACTDVDSIIAWVDLLYGSEGATLANAGKRNVEYVIEPNGTWVLTDPQNSYYMQISQLISGSNPYPGYSCDDFQMKYNQNSVVDRYAEYRALNAIAVRPFPYFTLSNAEESEVFVMQLDLGREVDVQLARWVRGDEELTPDSYKAFIDKLYTEYRLQEFKDFWQNILSR